MRTDDNVLFGDWTWYMVISIFLQFCRAKRLTGPGTWCPPPAPAGWPCSRPPQSPAPESGDLRPGPSQSRRSSLGGDRDQPWGPGWQPGPLPGPTPGRGRRAGPAGRCWPWCPPRRRRPQPCTGRPVTVRRTENKRERERERELLPSKRRRNKNLFSRLETDRVYQQVIVIFIYFSLTKTKEKHFSCSLMRKKYHKPGDDFLPNSPGKNSSRNKVSHATLDY